MLHMSSLVAKNEPFALCILAAVYSCTSIIHKLILASALRTHVLYYSALVLWNIRVYYLLIVQRTFGWQVQYLSAPRAHLNALACFPLLFTREPHLSHNR